MSTTKSKKRCWICHQEKDIQEFHRSITKNDGHQDACKACRGKYEKSYQAKYYLEHREELLPKHRITARASKQRKQIASGSKG